MQVEFVSRCVGATDDAGLSHANQTTSTTASGASVSRRNPSRYRSKPQVKRDLRDLELKREEIEALVAAAEHRVSVLRIRRWSLVGAGSKDDLRNQIMAVDENIKEVIKEIRPVRDALWRFVAGVEGKTLQAVQLRDELISRRQNLADRLHQLTRYDHNLDLSEDALVDEKRSLGRINSLIRAKHREQAKSEKLLSLKNKAAQNVDEKRVLAAAVKKGLRKHEDCPYCFLPLGNGAHADHIYPVSKGGESTQRNMVIVCEACNLKKRDKTLSTFIKEEGLDRDAIEARLDELGKDY